MAGEVWRAISDVLLPPASPRGSHLQSEDNENTADLGYQEQDNNTVQSGESLLSSQQHPAGSGQLAQLAQGTEGRRTERGCLGSPAHCSRS